MKTIVKIALGICLGFVLLVGGCAALVGGAMSGSDSGDDKSYAERKADDRKAEAKDKAQASDGNNEDVAATEKPEPSYTAGQENAMAKAEQYLDYSAFSREGLIGQLVFEKFPKADATFAVDHIKVNWNEQAAAKAEEYLDMQAFSRDGLIDQLEFEKFTPQQAAYGVKAAGL